MTKIIRVDGGDVREMLRGIEDSVKRIRPALETAPYAIAKPAIAALNDLVGDAAGALGFAIEGGCEVCGALILEGDDYLPYEDGVMLCAECQPPRAEIDRQRGRREAEDGDG